MSPRDEGGEPAGELILYQMEDGRTRIECRFDRGSIWLTQALLAELYQTSIQNINLHILNILRDGEVGPGATIKDYLIVRQEKGRKVRRTVKHYSLEMILAVGYRVRSERAQQWPAKASWSPVAASSPEDGPPFFTGFFRFPLAFQFCHRKNPKNWI